MPVMKKNTDFKYSKKLFSNTLTYKFSLTLNLVISLFCIILIGLYTIGNYQNFQDQSQDFILSVLAYAAIFNSLFSIVLIIETVIKLITEKYKLKNLFNIIGLIFSAIFSIFCTGFSNIISYISGGIR